MNETPRNPKKDRKGGETHTKTLPIYIYVGRTRKNRKEWIFTHSTSRKEIHTKKGDTKKKVKGELEKVSQ